MDRRIGQLCGRNSTIRPMECGELASRADRSKRTSPYNCGADGLCQPGYQSQTDGFWRFAGLFPFPRATLSEPGTTLVSGLSTRKIDMPIGTVKFFNNAKGFGFIKPDTGETDAFVHISAVERAGMATLDTDQRVSYELEEDRRG